MSYEEEKQDRKIEQLEAEIERLRGFETAARDLNNDLIRIAGERDELAASVQELEDALVEYQRLGKTVSEAVVPCLTAHGNCDQCRPKAKAACDAIETIRKGKIGPEDVKPRSWQITEERKAALSVIGNMKTLIVCPHCKTPIEFADIPPYMAVLRAMLEEVGQ